MPQIINVLIGDMHLVWSKSRMGKTYQINIIKKINNYQKDTLSRPGITGWAQIMYPYGLRYEDAEQKLMYDLYYIKNWSIWLGD